MRSFGSRAGSNAAYELTSTYTPAGQLQSQHLNSLVYDRDYGWNDNGDLVRISGPRQTREYGYSATGRLESVRTLAPDLDIRIPYATDPAGNRLPDPELHPDSTLTAWPDNRIAEDAHYVYHYDEYGRLTEKTDRIPTGVIRTDDERTHHYHYDSQHRLVFHTRIQHGEPLVESRYLYDPLGRRMAKRVWRRERDHRGLPLALISEDGNTAWSAEYDEWGNQLNEENPHHLHQPYRLPGQQYDKESGLYYNRNRYYDPLQGRYITQDPIGLEGGMESVCVPAESGEWY
ncbi:protein rhsE [Escherichia coli EPECa14]|nr:protein rhsE [Escherichia coli EPECa14]